MAAARSPIGCSVEETICELDDMKVNLIQVEKTQSTLKIWSGFRPKSPPQNWSPFFWLCNPGRRMRTQEMWRFYQQGWTNAMQNPSPRRTQHKCWKMPLKCAWGKLQWILLVQSTQLMRRTQNTIHPLRFLGICVKHYPHPLSTLRICLLEPQPIQGVKTQIAWIESEPSRWNPTEATRKPQCVVPTTWLRPLVPVDRPQRMRRKCLLVQESTEPNPFCLGCRTWSECTRSQCQAVGNGWWPLQSCDH